MLVDGKVKVLSYGGLHCEMVQLNNLNDSDSVYVFLTLSHDESSDVVHDYVSLWTYDVSFSGFGFCALEASEREIQGNSSFVNSSFVSDSFVNSSFVVNWVAVQLDSNQPGSECGSQAFDTWTAAKQCQEITFDLVSRARKSFSRKSQLKT